MAHLSAEQIAQHAYHAGFRGSALTTAVAVAMAESTGNTNAHNGVPPDNSYGLWQINMIGSLGPARRQEFGLKSDDQLFNPDKNAHAAWEISNHGTDFGPWSTYTDGAYQSHLAAARKAEQEVTKNHGKAPGGHGKTGAGHTGGTTAPGKTSGHGDNGSKSGGKKGSASGQTHVDPDRLHQYAQQVGKLGPGLTKASAAVTQEGQAVKADALGGVAGDGGFTDALRDFVDVYGSRIKQAGTAVDGLGASVTSTAKNYQGTENTNKSDLNALRA